MLNDRKECLVLLEEALIENHESHHLLFEISPEIRIDKEIISMIKYYEDTE